MPKNITIHRHRAAVYVVIDGHWQKLGAVQGQIVWQLVEAADLAFPWLAKEQLLENASSRATRLRDLFRRKPKVWALVHANGAGEYRLRPGRRIDRDRFEIA